MRALARLGPALVLVLALEPTGAGQTTGNLHQALAEQRAMAQRRPDDAGVWNDLGNLLALQGELGDAELAYARAIEIDPTSATARFNLGLLREQSGDLAGAAEAYRALLENDPAHAWAHYQLGTLQERQGQRSQALAHYAEAFTLDPELLFAETNPHVIENRLVTEALLLARRGSRSGPPAPRAYDEPRRIQSLLTPVAPPASGAAPVRDQAPVEGEAAAPDASDPLRSWFAPQPTPTWKPVSGSVDSEAASADPRDAAASDGVLDANDLRGGVSNQVQGGEAGGRAAAPATRPGRSAATVTPGRRRPLHQPPDQRSWSTLDPGQRSTGSLDWHLAPASDTPAPAR